MNFRFLILPFVVAIIGHRVEARELKLGEVLDLNETYSPQLKATRFREAASEENIKVQKAAYMPEVNFAAIVSNGNDGAFSMMDVDSDFSAAQRVGVGGGFVVRQNIWDFGRTSGSVAVAKTENRLEQTRARVSRLEVNLSILKDYIGCAFLRSQVESARAIAEQTQVLATETNKFVKSGQRSIVERYLVDAEVKEAETRIAEYSDRLAGSQKRLALELGEAGSVACTNLDGVDHEIDSTTGPMQSPLLDLQRAQLELARTKLERAKAEERPTIFGMATGGYFENSRLNEKLNYAGAIGIRIPLFDGFRVSQQIELSNANASAEAASVEAQRLAFERSQSQYEEQTSALQIRIDFLRREKKLADEVLSIARKRYFSLQGTMADLRDAIRNRSRILVATDEAYRDLYSARGSQRLISGLNLK